MWSVFVMGGLGDCQKQLVLLCCHTVLMNCVSKVQTLWQMAGDIMEKFHATNGTL